MSNDLDIRPTARDVVRSLDGWHWHERTDNYGSRSEWTELHGPHDLRVRLSIASARYEKRSEHMRIDIYGSLARYLGDHRDTYNHPEPSITVALTRAPAEIAREIERRIFPALFEALVAAETRRTEFEANERATRDNVARIRRACPAFDKPVPHHEYKHNGSLEIRAYPEHGHGVAKVYPERVDLKLELTPDLAVRVLRVLAPAWPPKIREREEA